jgi:uncharacterized protein
MQPNAIPTSNAARARDLTEEELGELDDLLFQTPKPLYPLEVISLDGYLCGVIVQPVLVEPAAWLPYVFDLHGLPLPEQADPEWLRQITALIMRRYVALNRAICEDGWFDPIVGDFDEEDPDNSESISEPTVKEIDEQTAAEQAISARGEADTTSHAAEGDPAQHLSPVSLHLLPWVEGFALAIKLFPDLAEMHDDAVMSSLARLYRHLPAETDQEREIVATLDRECPLPTLDDAVEELIVTVADLQDLTREHRFKVDTVKRKDVKVGRNDPCPCGSGRKFKRCHGLAG